MQCLGYSFEKTITTNVKKWNLLSSRRNFAHPIRSPVIVGLPQRPSISHIVVVPSCRRPSAPLELDGCLTRFSFSNLYLARVNARSKDSLLRQVAVGDHVIGLIRHVDEKSLDNSYNCTYTGCLVRGEQ